MSGDNVENVHSDNERQRECPRCSRLESTITGLKEVHSLRKGLLDLREKEAKDLITKLKFFEEAIEIERKIRLQLTRRVESAEQQCILLTGNLRRNEESFKEMQTSYDNKIADLVSNMETSDQLLAACKRELSASQEKNDFLNNQMSDLDKLVSDSQNAVRKVENQLKVTVDRNKVLSYQMSLLNNLFNETDLVLIDFNKIKEIGDIVRETHNLPEIQLHTADEEGARRSSVDIQNVIEKIDSEKNSEEIPGEESCYKSVDTVRGPELVLSVSRTFIKLKDLILEKKALQKEIDTLKTLNSKLETKVDKQERRLYCVTVELNKTWNLVSKLKVQHNKLHTNEAVLKYELQEKRRQLEKLKIDLSSSHEKWLKARQKTSESQIIWENLRDEFSRRKQESSQESAFSENMSSSSANEDEEGAAVIVVTEEGEGQINEGYEEPEGAYGITLIPGEEIVEDYMDPLEDMVSDLVEEIEETAAEGDAEDEGIDESATSSEESSSERVIRRANRLRMLEEQCHLLHAKLLASTARSAALSSKLASLHNHYGSRDSDPENSEIYEQDTSRTGEASTSAYTADTEATINQTRSDVYDTEMPSSENGSQYGGEIPVIINHSENNESNSGTETFHNAEVVLDVVPVPLVDFVDSLPDSEIVLQPIVHGEDVTASTDNLPLRDSVHTPNLIITTHNPSLQNDVDLDQQNNNIYEDRQFGMQLQVQIDPEDEIGDSADLLSEFDVSREQSQSPLLLHLETGSGIHYVDVDNEIGNESEEDNDDEGENHKENSSSSEGSFSGSPDPNYLGRLILKQLPLRLEILKRENQALMKEAVEVKLEMKETERLLKQQVSRHKKANDKLKNQIETRNLVEFELREELGHKEQTIEELQKEIQDAKFISESFKRKEEIINDFIKKVTEEKFAMECSKVDLKLIKSCHDCDKPFSLFRRKNYCSVCSQVFCKTCAPKRKSSCISISQTRFETKQRTCTSCEDRREQIDTLATQFSKTNF